MGNDFAAGDIVSHEQFGIGKVLSNDGASAHIYFKNPGEPSPDTRVRKFRLPLSTLAAWTGAADAELTNLPPWKDGKFDRFATKLSLKGAKEAFLGHFPLGFNDERYLSSERQYKASASGRYSSFLPTAWAAIEEGDGRRLASMLDTVYGDRQAARGGPDERLNLLYQRVEEPAFFDALGADPVRTVEYARAALRFAEDPEASNFQSYLGALQSLPTREGGAQLDNWTTFTWLPFIASPRTHVLVKPTIIRSFASLIPFNLPYESRVNLATYRASVELYRTMLQHLQDSELNSGRRELDMVDVQSFMWVVERWEK